MKKLIVALLIMTFPISSFAEIGLKFNIHGEFIPPDMVLQARGLDSYNKGYKESSLRNLKKSARFGNERSKYLIAMMSFQDKDWSTGYAWLNLIGTSIENRDGLLLKVGTLLSSSEIAASEVILDNLKLEYNKASSLKRRLKWERSLKGVGTHIRGIDAMTIRNVSMDFGDNSAPLSSYEVTKQVHTYVNEYVPKGIVEMGVIKAIENKN